MSLGTTRFAGNDFTSWTTGGSTAVSPNTQYFRSAWVASAMTVTSTQAAPCIDFIKTWEMASHTEGWMHALVTAQNTGITSTDGAVLMRLLDTGGNELISVQGTGTTGQVKVVKPDGMGGYITLCTGSGLVSTPAGETFVDMNYNYASSGGFVTLFFNDVIVAGFSGDTTSGTGMQQIAFADFSCPSVGSLMAWSEVIFSDSIMINAGLFRLNPVAAGVTQNWTGISSDIDKISVNDTTYIGTGTTGELSGWTVPASLPTGSWLVQSVVQEARMAIGLGGPAHAKWYVHAIDASDNLSSGTISPATTFDNFHNIWTQDPATSADWTTADLASPLNLGLESEP